MSAKKVPMKASSDILYDGVKKLIKYDIPVSGSVVEAARRMVKPPSAKKEEKEKANYRLSLLAKK